MRLIIILAALALPAFAQTKTASKYLVEYSTTEKCYECGVRLAIGCLPGNADCGVPDKAVPHFEQFDSIRNALTFINGGMYKTGSITGTIPIYGAYEPKVRAFVRLLAVQEVELTKVVSTVEEPQPPKKVETVTYRHGTETGERTKVQEFKSLTGTLLGSGSNITFSAVTSTAK